jgi:DNA-binding transcriptional MocR family regulator
MYLRLARALRSALATGELPGGCRLPAERELAPALAVSRTTVVAAYNLLRGEGVLRSRRGGGTWAADDSAPDARPAPVASMRRNPLFRSLVDETRAEIDLAAGGHAGLTRLIEEAAAESAGALLDATRSDGYHPAGLPALREAIAAEFERRGVPTEPGQVLVTSGAQQAISLVAAAYVERGDRVAIEDPAFVGALDAFTNAGAALVSLPVGPSGVDPEALADIARRSPPRLVFLVPTHQNPTGSVMPEQRRRALAALAADRGLALVEDETPADLSATGAPPPPPVALGAAGTVFTIGSLSKLVWGGLRVGWIRGPEREIARLAGLKAVGDLGSSLPAQVAAVRLLGRLDEARALRHAEVRAALDTAEEQLGLVLPSWAWTRPPGGFAVWLRLPAGDGASFAQTAARHGVSVLPGWVTSPSMSYADHVRIHVLHPPGRLQAGIERLADAWAAYAEPGRAALGVVV